MRRPLIGITMDTRSGDGYYQLACDYTMAIEKAGGLPLAIPYKTDPALIPDYLDALDGMLFTGGDDLDPASYGQSWHPEAHRIDSARQAFEMTLLAAVEKRRIPMLAICLGCQLLNVHRGGSLHQFLPDLAGLGEHRKTSPALRRHPVILEDDSKIAATIGRREISVNTYHKQAIDRVGKGLIITARADDGVIEGVEDPSFPMMVAVQWHPERLQGETEHQAPFRLLIAKALEFKR